MPQPITPMVMRSEAGARPALAQVVRGRTTAAPAAERNCLRVKGASGLETFDDEFIRGLQSFLCSSSAWGNFAAVLALIVTTCHCRPVTPQIAIQCADRGSLQPVCVP